MNRTPRTVSLADPLWTALETMSREMGVDRDVLLNQAVFSLARQFGFITPTQVSLLDAAAPPARAPAPAPVPEPTAPVQEQPVDVSGPVDEVPRETAPSAPESAQADEAAREPAVDVEALRLAAVARIQDIVADVDRLVEPMADRPIGDEGEDAPDKDPEEDEADEEEASDEEEAPDDEEASADEAPRPSPKPAAPAETTIIVQTASVQSLRVKLDDREPVLVARERFIIGRGPSCDLMVKSARVSREHVAVVREGAEYFIEDLGSSNGTWFEDERITRRQVLDGEEYLLGGIRVTFTLG